VAGKYELRSPIGQGATGRVYEAENLVTGRRVALKIVEAGVGEGESVFREARAAGQIESRYIAQVLDAGVDDGKPYIVFELLRGADLGAVLARCGPLEPALALRLVGQACIGLAKAHAAGILHRDIKPANLFVAREDEGVVVKLLDFGLAKALTPEALGDIGRRSLTSERTLVGTPLYMSPEQARSAKEIDARSDLWSLGVVLYEALTGATPHEAEKSLGDIIIAICTKQVRIGDRAPWLPRDVAALVDRALDLDAARRFQTAEEMGEAIRSVVGSFAVDAAALEPALPRTSAAPPGSADGSAPANRPGGSGTAIHDAETLVADSGAGIARSRTLTLPTSQVVVETSVRDGYLLACVRGRMSTEDDAHASNAFLAQALESAGLRALLLDARLADGTKQGHAALWSWIREHKAFDRMAVLVESTALMRGFNVQAAEYAVAARAFDDFAEAEAWLRGPARE